MKHRVRCHRAVLLLISWRISCWSPCPSYFFWPFSVCVYSDCLYPHHRPSCCCCWGHTVDDNCMTICRPSFCFFMMWVCVSVRPGWWFLSSFAVVSVPPLSVPFFFLSTESAETVATVPSLCSVPVPQSHLPAEKYHIFYICYWWNCRRFHW